LLGLGLRGLRLLRKLLPVLAQLPDLIAQTKQLLVVFVQAGDFRALGGRFGRLCLFQFRARGLSGLDLAAQSLHLGILLPV
jgi:hypothetical protein